MSKHNKQLILAALFIGWGVDWLFYGKPVGISLLLFALVAVGVMVWNGRLHQLPAQRRNLWLIVPLIFFAAMAFLRANPFLTTMNTLAALGLLSYLLFFYAAGRVAGIGLNSAWLIPFRVGGHSLRLAGPVISDSVDVTWVRENGRKQLFPVVRGGLLASPVLIVFTILLTSADVIFADYIEKALSLDIIPHLLEWSWRGLLILLIGWLAVGALVYMVERRTQQDDESAFEKALSHLPMKIGLGYIESMTVLILVNLLFFSFVLVQFTYLFGGVVNVETAGYTFADYARRGFFELVAVAVLTLSLILGLNWMTRRSSKGQIRWFNLLSSVMVGFVLVMLVSAFQRMRLYEAAFGYTRLRLYVYLFMLWLGVLLIWFLLSQWLRPDRFAIGGLVVAMGFLTTLNVINPDAFIARQNVVRYQQTGDLDVLHLTTLSDDAVPVLVAALPIVAADPQVVTKPECDYFWREDRSDYDVDCDGTLSEILTESLNGRFQEMQNDTSWQAWQAYHASRWRAYRQLRPLFGENNEL
ncbi:MAG: DUF4173 domain-containing protein [Anaerolineales bacterium]|nr:DUF4173 domain-containing protein [Anaerolineales bacterium]